MTRAVPAARRGLARQVQIGLSTTATWGLPLTLSERISLFADAGIDLVEVDLDDWWKAGAPSSELDGLVVATESRKVRVLSMHLPPALDVSDPHARRRARSLRELARVLDSIAPAAERLRLAYLVLHPGGHLKRYSEDEYVRRTRRCRASLSTVLEHDLFSTVKLALENTLSNQYGGRPQDLAACARGFGEDRLGFCLDTCHSVFDFSPEAFIASLGRRLVGFHVSDNSVARDLDLHAFPFTLRTSAIDWPSFCRSHRTNALPTRIIFEVMKTPEQPWDAFFAAHARARDRFLAVYRDLRLPGPAPGR